MKQTMKEWIIGIGVILSIVYIWGSFIFWDLYWIIDVPNWESYERIVFFIPFAVSLVWTFICAICNESEK